MRNRQSLRIGSLWMRIACVLFCLVLVSTAMMSRLYAKYFSGSDSDDIARVAKFAVGADLNPDDVEVILTASGGTGEYEIRTENDSEVAVSYDIIITTNLPAGISLRLDGKTVTDADGVYTFQNVGQLASGTDVTASHSLQFIADTNAFTKTETGATVTQDIAFQVTVRFVQID